MSVRRALVLVAIGAVALVGCGSGDDGPALSPAAEAGRAIMRDNACASCHGANGQGGVGPAFQGLFGTEVPLDDGSTVIADAEYLAESIRELDAKIVDGYRVPMPPNDLSDEEIAEVIAFIEAIGPEQE